MKRADESKCENQIKFPRVHFVSKSDQKKKPDLVAAAVIEVKPAGWRRE
jgi:hypothetical protein